MNREGLRCCVGSWVGGEDFFDREHELAQLEQLLLDGCHVSLVAQRRTGKTSLLHAVGDSLAGRLTCLYVDLQSARDASDAIVLITLATRGHQGLWMRARGAFSNIMGGVEELGLAELSLKLREGVLRDWAAKGDRVLEDLSRSEVPVVLMLDELPVLLVNLLREDPREAERFLYWLRRACLRESGGLRVVVTGSIGLGPVAHRAGLSGTLNHYAPMLLEPWTPSTALACLAALGRQYSLEWAPDAAEEVVAQIGSCVPYHVQIFFKLLEEDARRHRRTTINKLDVQRVYTQRMLSVDGHAELAHMEERLRMMVPPEHHALVLEILTETAVNGRLQPSAALALAASAGIAQRERSAVLRDLLDVLEHDGYLERADDGYRFTSKLLRDWWRARFESFYVPAAER